MITTQFSLNPEKEHRLLYGEIVFDRIGKAIGCIWRPENRKEGDLEFKAKTFNGLYTRLFDSRELAISFCIEHK